MTTTRTAPSIFAALLAGCLVCLSAGCGYEHELIVEEEEEAAKPASTATAASPAAGASGGTQSASQSGGSQTGSTQSAGQQSATPRSDAASATDSAAGAPEAEDPEPGGTTETQTETRPSGTPIGPTDSVSFGALDWKYGGFNGGRAALSSPRLSSLSCRNNTLSYRWVTGLEGWGLGHGEAGAICAAFVLNESGHWVGGKFDWVSTSRTSRGLAHILSGYGGWSLAGVPNPCQICFVVVDANGNRRSNVVGPVTWSR